MKPSWPIYQIVKVIDFVGSTSAPGLRGRPNFGRMSTNSLPKTDWFFLIQCETVTTRYSNKVAGPIPIFYIYNSKLLSALSAEFDIAKVGINWRKT